MVNFLTKRQKDEQWVKNVAAWKHSLNLNSKVNISDFAACQQLSFYMIF